MMAVDFLFISSSFKEGLVGVGGGGGVTVVSRFTVQKKADKRNSFLQVNLKQSFKLELFKDIF